MFLQFLTCKGKIKRILRRKNEDLGRFKAPQSQATTKHIKRSVRHLVLCFVVQKIDFLFKGDFKMLKGSHKSFISIASSLIHNLLFQVLCTLILGVLLAAHLSPAVASFFYSISSSIKDLLVFALPVVIFSYLASSILSYEASASKLVGGIFLGMIGSIFVALLYSYGAGQAFLAHLMHAGSASAGSATSLALPPEESSSVQALWSLHLPCLATEKAMVFSLVFAFWMNFLQSSWVTRLRNSHYHKAEGQGLPHSALKGLFSLGIFATVDQLSAIKTGLFKLKSACEKALMKLFVPVIPLYIFGYIIKLSKESASQTFFKEFSSVFLFNFLCIILFVVLAFMVAAKFHVKEGWTALKTMAPATVTGFSTMSSVATMPVTIQATEKNLGEGSQFAKLVIPTTVNIHAIGDVINVSLSGLALLLMAGQGMPSLGAYLSFAVYTCLAQFSCVSVPGGGIIVMTGILQNHLGLSGESVMLLTSIYFLLEPFLTACNVTYNGAFTLILRRLFRAA